MATKSKSAKITSVKKGDIYETNSGQLLEVTSARLQDEGEHGVSFEGRTIAFNLETGKSNRATTTYRFYLDELAKKLSKKDYDEWVEAGRREAEAMADAKAPAEAKVAKKAKAPRQRDGNMSALEAAAKVLAEAGEPLDAKTMIEAMAAKGYWTSPGGKTPHATLYAAIIREIAKKGAEARFQKTDRGSFTVAGAGTTKATAAKPAAKAKGKTPAKIADGTPGPKSVSDLFKI